MSKTIANAGGAPEVNKAPDNVKRPAMVSFITAGDPSLEKTRDFIGVLAGYSDVIEIGLPFSDPIAEGEVIQAANMRSLNNGTTADKVFDMLETVEFGKMVILTYINPVFTYGYERFFKRCMGCGVYGVIIPDLPFEERPEAAAFADKYGVNLITMIAPTSAERVKMLAKDATGFIYLVSSMGVTGVRSEFSAGLAGIVKQIREVTSVPVYIGFGISTPEQAAKMGEIADGVIVGSAFVKIIAQHGNDAGPHIKKLIRELTCEHEEKSTMHRGEGEVACAAPCVVL